MSEAENRAFGVVFFDDEQDPQEAWVSVEGRTAKRVSGPNELPTDIIWWTNISYEMFFKRSEIWRLPWLRHDKYLVVSPKDTMQEWGLDPKTVSADYAAVVCSSAFSRVMRLAFRLYQQVEPRAVMDQVFTGRALRDDMRKLLPDAEYPKGEAAAVMKSGRAWQEFTRTTVRGIKGARWLMLRRPRLSYAMEMLQVPVPRGPFDFIGRSELRGMRDKTQWVLDHKQPLISEVSITTMDGDIAPIYGFGNATEQERRVSRNWVAHPEMAVLSKFAKVDVKGAYIGSEYEVLAPRLEPAIQSFFTNKISEFSWSAGVVAETLWRAAALAEEKGKARDYNQDERAHASWAGAWLKAADKSTMFLDAMKLTEMGYSVVSYGLGWIRIMVPEEEVGEAIKDGLTTGLIPLLVDVPKNLVDPNRLISWGGDKQSAFYAQWTAAADRSMLWNLDKLPLMATDQRDKMLQRLITAWRSGKV